MENIKILKNIIIDKNELKNFYNSIKHKAKNYTEIHPKNKKNPYLVCARKKYIKLHNNIIDVYGDGHKFIRRLERYKNHQITELIEYMHGLSDPLSVVSKNVRVALPRRGSRPSINDDLKKTYETEPNQFWYSHNGITIICDKIQDSKIVLDIHYFGMEFNFSEGLVSHCIQ